MSSEETFSLDNLALPDCTLQQSDHLGNCAEASEAHLRCNGVQVDVLDTVPEIGTTFRKWARAHPDLWCEDIGEPATDAPPRKKTKTRA